MSEEELQASTTVASCIGQPVGTYPGQPIGTYPGQLVGSNPGRTVGSNVGQTVGSNVDQTVGTNTDSYLIIERNIKGLVVTINRLKHFYFIKRSDKAEARDIFAREASILADTREKKKLFLSDKVKFDLIRTRRGPEAINIEIVERHVNKISQLEKIPKKKKSEPEGQILNELFESTIARIVREVFNKRK